MAYLDGCAKLRVTGWNLLDAWEVIPGQISEFRSTYGSHVPTRMAGGWLYFDCGSEKRRLYALPSDWADRTDAEPWFLCRAAEPVRARAAAGCDAPPADAEPAIGAGVMETETAGV